MITNVSPAIILYTMSHWQLLQIILVEMIKPFKEQRIEIVDKSNDLNKPAKNWYCLNLKRNKVCI